MTMRTEQIFLDGRIRPFLLHRDERSSCWTISPFSPFALHQLASSIFLPTSSWWSMRCIFFQISIRWGHFSAWFARYFRWTCSSSEVNCSPRPLTWRICWTQKLNCRSNWKIISPANTNGWNVSRSNGIVCICQNHVITVIWCFLKVSQCDQGRNPSSARNRRCLLRQSGQCSSLHQTSDNGLVWHWRGCLDGFVSLVLNFSARKLNLMI